ncbi:MAG: N-formylglutamate amidohydrolase [Rhodobiaceae bacterium]|nr:N-formylglutamate amidohydrolase [Rhodobiaceae bacterium]MCC0057204.1 N-formylglutamate amidohydrolase [Rhodobiaceae bacterium]
MDHGETLRTQSLQEIMESFDILIPQDGVDVPFLFNSPHSGNHYPEDFIEAARLTIGDLRRSEDCFVDELFAGALDLGAVLMRARLPRAFVDLNREPYELDPSMFDAPLPAFVNSRSVRVSGGLGTIARIVAERKEIYARQLTVEEGLSRIEKHYKPYHRALVRLLSEIRGSFGAAILVDCHSMPSARIAGETRPRPDFVIGDRYGTSCSDIVANAVQESLTAMGYRVTRNKPYAGGFITERYGNPSASIHAVQIEINRALYMDETRYTRSNGYSWICADLTRMMRHLVNVIPGQLLPQRTAAE